MVQGNYDTSIPSALKYSGYLFRVTFLRFLDNRLLQLFKWSEAGIPTLFSPFRLL